MQKRMLSNVNNGRTYKKLILKVVVVYTYTTLPNTLIQYSYMLYLFIIIESVVKLGRYISSDYFPNTTIATFCQSVQIALETGQKYIKTTRTIERNLKIKYTASHQNVHRNTWSLKYIMKFQ
jgi:hypothetical protein